MITSEPVADSSNEEFVDVRNSLESVVNELEVYELSSDEESDISLSEKIVLESNEKRLRQRMTSLQTSIINLKEQLKLEKELWKEDLEKIRQLQSHQEIRCRCPHTTVSKETVKSENTYKSNSYLNLGGGEMNPNKSEIFKTHSIKQLLELQNYKRKLAETENMCNLELTRVKQSLDDLKTLQTIASEWGKHREEIGKEKENDAQPIQEIFVNSNNKTE